MLTYLCLSKILDPATEKSMYLLQLSVPFVSLQLVRFRSDKWLEESSTFSEWQLELS